jgi:hypothetical protein
MTKQKTTDKTCYLNQTELGKPYNLSAIEVGKLLMNEGLKDRETKQPSERAYKENYAIPKKTREGANWYLWNVSKIKPILERADEVLRNPFPINIEIPFSATPSINIDDVKERRFEIIDRAAQTAREDIIAEEDKRVFNNIKLDNFLSLTYVEPETKKMIEKTEEKLIPNELKQELNKAISDIRYGDYPFILNASLPSSRSSFQEIEKSYDDYEKLLEEQLNRMRTAMNKIRAEQYPKTEVPSEVPKMERLDPPKDNLVLIYDPVLGTWKYGSSTKMEGTEIGSFYEKHPIRALTSAEGKKALAEVMARPIEETIMPPPKEKAETIMIDGVAYNLNDPASVKSALQVIAKYADKFFGEEKTNIPKEEIVVVKGRSSGKTTLAAAAEQYYAEKDKKALVEAMTSSSPRVGTKSHGETLANLTEYAAILEDMLNEPPYDANIDTAPSLEIKRKKSSINPLTLLGLIAAGAGMKELTNKKISAPDIKVRTVE